MYIRSDRLGDVSPDDAGGLGVTQDTPRSPVRDEHGPPTRPNWGAFKPRPPAWLKGERLPEGSYSSYRSLCYNITREKRIIGFVRDEFKLTITLPTAVLATLGRSLRPLKAREIVRSLRISPGGPVEKRVVNRLLYRLQSTGIVVRDNSFRWQLAPVEFGNLNAIQAVVHGNGLMTAPHHDLPLARKRLRQPTRTVQRIGRTTDIQSHAKVRTVPDVSVTADARSRGLDASVRISRKPVNVSSGRVSSVSVTPVKGPREAFGRFDRMDATRSYAHSFREHGHYGSHPAHDDFDDESCP